MSWIGAAQSSVVRGCLLVVLWRQLEEVPFLWPAFRLLRGHRLQALSRVLRLLGREVVNPMQGSGDPQCFFQCQRVSTICVTEND